jgi:hypothetical protein
MVPMDDRTRERLTTLRIALLKHHRRLLDSEKAIYERDVARIETTGQYLNLVMSDPWFTWLRELSQFIVLIDEALVSKEPATAADGDRLVAKARELILPAENGSGFRHRYYEAMQRDPAVVLAHGDIMRVFAGLGE